MAVFGLIRDAAEYFGNLGRVLGHRGDARLFLNKASPESRFGGETFERVVKFPLYVGFVQKPTILCEKLDVSPKPRCDKGVAGGEGLADPQWLILKSK